MLSSLYRYGEFAYIGGGFRGGLHNTLEAAVYGVPVFFGRHANNNKFKEAMDLVSLGGAMEISGSDELIHIMEEMIDQQMKYKNTPLPERRGAGRSRRIRSMDRRARSVRQSRR